MAVGVIVVMTGGRLATGAADFLNIDPAEGPPNTPYKVTVHCSVEPTLYERTIDEDPPATIPPLEVARAGPSEWTYDATASGYDDLYWASCGSSSSADEQKRFDADAPRIFLGPVPDHGPVRPEPALTVEGTDCPDGTTAQVTITLDGRPTTHTATIDQYGDWVVNLPAPAGTRAMTVTAACGAVHYARLGIATTTTTTSTTTTTTTTPATGTTPPGAVPAVPSPAQATFTG